MWVSGTQEITKNRTKTNLQQSNQTLCLPNFCKKIVLIKVNYADKSKILKVPPGMTDHF